MKKNSYSLENRSLISLGTRVLLIFTLGLCLSSCSFTGRRSLLGGSDKDKSSRESGTVPKVQYDQLMAKYERLLKNSRDKNQSPLGMEEIVDDLVKAPNAELAETVDVFAQKNSNSRNEYSRPAPVISGTMTTAPDEQIEREILQIRKAQRFMDARKYDNSLSILKGLEASNVPQIRVRAKYMVGELLFEQESFDLAMQVYEEIIQKYAFSGIVIKVLGRLIVCSEKLKLGKKQEKYYSILHDFFEST